MAKAKLWSFTAGRRGVNRVRVYERYAGSPIQVEWYLGGQRYQRSLEHETGYKIHDHRDAMRLADRLARRLEQSRNAKMRQHLFGTSPHRTMAQLLVRLHTDREDGWSAMYVSDQSRYRRFWLDKLGEGTVLATVSAAMVESVARREAKAREWSPRSHGAALRYIVDAFYYAERKLKWLTPQHNLSAVSIPSPKSRGRSYSLVEVKKLLAGFEAVDDRAGWIGHVLWQTGRRLTAVRTLPKSAVELRDGHAVITFPGETDKTGREGVAVIVGRAFELTGDLMQRPGRYVLGTEPASLDECVKIWLPNAESAGDVKHVKGRGWHGLKRSYSNVSKGLPGRDRQSGTREDTLRRVYEVDDDLAPKLEVALHLNSEIE